MDSHGYPHISYYDWTNITLKYAKWDGSGWQKQTIVSVVSGVCFTSLFIDSNGFSHISYQENGSVDGDLKYAKWNGVFWSTSTVDSNGNTGHDSSLTLDSNNYPHISYANYTDNTLKYAGWNGSSWDIETIVASATDDIHHTCIALDSNNQPHISYHDPAGNDLRYAHWDGVIWNIETIDSDGDVGIHSCIVLDSNDHPHISYGCTYNTGNLKYAVWNGLSWDIEIVDSEINTGRYSFLCLDKNEYPCISYNNMDNRNLKLACWDRTKWEIEIIDSNNGFVYSTSMVLDYNYNPHIAYYVGWNYSDLRYAKGTDIVPPAIINDLSAITGRLAGTVNLTWTSPGDNGNSGNILNGEYRMEYSQDANANWGDSSNYTLQWLTNTTPGSYEVVTLNDLDPGAAYYFWMKTADERPNWSELSVRASSIARLPTDLFLVGVSPRIFTPNNDGINDVVTFIYENPKNDRVCGKIFDMGGSVVRDNLYQNSISSLIWDGKNNENICVKGGVYIYQIKAGNSVINGTVVLAK